MTGGDIISASLFGIIQKGLKFNFLITEYIWIWSTAGTVFIQEIGKHALPVFVGEIDHMQIDLQQITNRLCISHVFCCRAIAVSVIAFPVFHENPFYMMAGFLE